MLVADADGPWIRVTLKLGVVVAPLLVVLMAVGSMTSGASPAAQHDRDPQLHAGEPATKVLKQVPAHEVFYEGGDEFWFMNRGPVNPARLQEQASTGRGGVSGPVRVSDAELLQFDGATHELKRIYPKPGARR